MRKSVLAIGVAASIGLAGTAAPAAFAAPHHQAGAFKVTVSPSKPKVGQTVKAKATGALKNQSYYCLLSLYKKGAKLGASYADTGSLVTVKSSSKGTISCSQIFLKFHGTAAQSKVKCPPTKANKKAGYSCGVAFANVKNHKLFKVGLFKF